MYAMPDGYYSERLPDGRVALFPGQPLRPSRTAQARWDAKNYVTLSTRVDLQTAIRFNHLCATQDKSIYRVLRDYVETMAATGGGNGGD